MSDAKDSYCDSKRRDEGDYDYDYKRDRESNIDAKSEGKDEDAKGVGSFVCPKVDVINIKLKPNGRVLLTSPLSLSMQFELDREVTGYWRIQFLVDSANKRIIKRLGRTETEDYYDG